MIVFRSSRKLGFSIGYAACDYGLCIPHYGTMVFGISNLKKLYATLHTSSCITDTGRINSKEPFLAIGAKIIGNDIQGDYIVVAANSGVTNSFPDVNVLQVGMPAP